MKTFLEMALLPHLSFAERLHYLQLSMEPRLRHLAVRELKYLGFVDD